MNKEELKELSLEETFTQIEEVFKKLQDKDITLEQSFDVYKDGMEMLEHARSVIDTVEKKVIELSGQNIEEVRITGSTNSIDCGEDEEDIPFK